MFYFFFGEKSEAKITIYKILKGSGRSQKLGWKGEGRKFRGSGGGVPGLVVDRLVAVPAGGPVVPGVVPAVSPLPAVTF